MNLSEQQLNEWIEELRIERTDGSAPTESRNIGYNEGLTALRDKILAELNFQDSNESILLAQPEAEFETLNTEADVEVWAWAHRIVQSTRNHEGDHEDPLTLAREIVKTLRVPVQPEARCKNCQKPLSAKGAYFHADGWDNCHDGDTYLGTMAEPETPVPAQPERELEQPFQIGDQVKLKMAPRNVYAVTNVIWRAAQGDWKVALIDEWDRYLIDVDPKSLELVSVAAVLDGGEGEG